MTIFNNKSEIHCIVVVCLTVNKLSLSKYLFSNSPHPQTHGRSKIIIDQRQKKYQQHLKQIQNDINEYLKQAPTLIDMNKIIQLLNHLIHQDQTSFRSELERRKDVLKFDTKEHQYVHAFYHLNQDQQKLVQKHILH